MTSNEGIDQKSCTEHLIWYLLTLNILNIFAFRVTKGRDRFISAEGENFFPLVKISDRQMKYQG